MRLFVPRKDSHKGENGKLLIIGGSRRYHGAPMFSILAARRFIDLVYFHPGENDPYLISAVKAIPEAMVVYDLDSEFVEKMDCVLFGIGLANAKISGFEKIKKSKRLVIDGDGLKLIAKTKIPEGAILTPHEGEFRLLFGMEGSEANVKKMAAKHRCVILKKGPVDFISDGKRLVANKKHNQGMTKGGTGDVLAGLVAALACKNDLFTAAVAGAMINGHAGDTLKKKYGYNFCAGDLADALAESYNALFGVK